MELLYDLWLDSIKGCGCVTAAKLIKTFGSAKAVYEVDDPGAFMEIQELPYDTAFALVMNKNLDTAQEQAELITRRNISYLTLSDAEYPAILKEIHDPPLILYYREEMCSSVAPSPSP